MNNHRAFLTFSFFNFSLTLDSTEVPLAPSVLTAWPGKMCCSVSQEAEEVTSALTELRATALGFTLCTDADWGKAGRNFNPEEPYLSAKSLWNWPGGSILILGCLVSRQMAWSYRVFFPVEARVRKRVNFSWIHSLSHSFLELKF